MKHKFRLNQAVWIDCGDDGRVPGKVTSLDYSEVVGSHYGVEVDSTDIVLSFPEEDLTARYIAERIGGLAQIRRQMEDEKAAQEDYSGCLGVPDDELTPQQLDDKYNPEGDGEHPLFTRKEWRHEVWEGNTLSGYWDWVSYKLNE